MKAIYEVIVLHDLLKYTCGCLQEYNINKRASIIVRKAKVSLGLIKLRSDLYKKRNNKEKTPTYKCLHKKLCTDNSRNVR